MRKVVVLWVWVCIGGTDVVSVLGALDHLPQKTAVESKLVVVPGNDGNPFYELFFQVKVLHKGESGNSCIQ